MACSIWSDGARFTEADSFLPISHGSRAITGAESHPDYWTFDSRLRYVVAIRDPWALDLFLDVFNVFDQQKTILVEESHNDPSFTQYRQPRLLVSPRRYQLAARVRF